MQSDVVRDGIALELMEDRNTVAEVFYSDQSHRMTFTAYKPDLPLDLVEGLIEAAKRRLPPVR